MRACGVGVVASGAVAGCGDHGAGDRAPAADAARGARFAVGGGGVWSSDDYFRIVAQLFSVGGGIVAIGACDNVSVIVRQTLVQMLTPDSMRGRVSAVKSVFSSTSDGIGALESGLTAAMLGPRIAVVAGGIGTLLVSLAVSAWWPEMREFGSLGEAVPAAEKASGAESTDRLQTVAAGT